MANESEEVKPELKLMTKEQFESVKHKYQDISAKAENIINQATNNFDVLVLTVREGSKFSVLDALILREENESDFFEVLKEGAIETE